MPSPVARLVRRVAAAVLVLAPLAAVVACSDDSSTGPDALPLALSITTPRDTLLPGQLLTLTVVARNVSSAPVTVNAPASCLLDAVVRVAPFRADAVVGGRECGAPTDVTIAPGATISETYVMEASSQDTPSFGGLPGDYLLVPVVREGASGQRRGTDVTAKLIVIRSATAS